MTMPPLFRPFSAQTTCNICGSTEFTRGNLTRRPDIPPPQCSRCRSVERHRLIRELYMPLRPLVKDWRAFQFAPDRSVEPNWFQSFRSSIFEDASRVDMMEIPFGDGAYDIVISNHVLEHVSDDIRALRETLRVVGATGIVHVCVPSPIYRWETEDWGFPDPRNELHYRHYGADFPMRMRGAIPNSLCVSVTGVDPVTGSTDNVYFFSYSAATLQLVARQFQHFAIPVARFW
ncbi:MAG: class I SAM-dependent methyltransferase [Methanobacterium sp.]|nr:class I SAM-dependent methyltransferase [Methanobacterium sp.]